MNVQGKKIKHLAYDTMLFLVEAKFPKGVVVLTISPHDHVPVFELTRIV